MLLDFCFSLIWIMIKHNLNHVLKEHVYENEFLLNWKIVGALQLINHLSVITGGYENIKQDVMEPQRGKREQVTKEFRLDNIFYRLEENSTSLQKVMSSLDANLAKGHKWWDGFFKI